VSTVHSEYSVCIVYAAPVDKHSEYSACIVYAVPVDKHSEYSVCTVYAAPVDKHCPSTHSMCPVGGVRWKVSINSTVY
jgi:hypothetical protein